jgi:site-specific DNA-methyltransferase (adenine-specific)
MTPDWQTPDGSIRLYCADCLEVLPQLKDGDADSTITDPPYGVSLKEVRTKHTTTPAKYASTNDSESSVLETILPAMEHCIRISQAVAVLSGVRLVSKYPPPRDIGSVFFPNGAGIGPWGFICTHPILYYGKCPYLARGLGSRPNSVSATHWNRRDDAEHPCEKPLKMMEWLVLRASLENQIILDPFMGSGTTGVACIRTGRKFIGVEKEPKYFEIAVKRIQAELDRTPLFAEAEVVA